MNSDRIDNRETNRNQSDLDGHELKTLREQLNNLAEEKNTLLDYINENIDKFGSISNKKNSGMSQSESQTQLVMELKAKINHLEAQNDNLLR